MTEWSEVQYALGHGEGDCVGGDVPPPVCNVQAKEYFRALLYTLPVKNFLLGDIFSVLFVDNSYP